METVETPNILYKYRDWDDENHKRLLVDNEVYFATPKQFNDPFDCAIPFRYDEKDLTEENIFKKALTFAKRLYPDLDDQKHHELAYKSQQEKRLFDPDILDKHNKKRQEHFQQKPTKAKFAKSPMNLISIIRFKLHNTWNEQVFPKN